MYSDNKLSELLDNYWSLYEGILPWDSGSTRPEVANFESAAIFKADLDKAIDSLTSDHRWSRTVEAMDAYFSDGGNPRDLFYDAPSYYNRLSKFQKALMKHHFKVKNTMEYMENEALLADVARRIMLKYLNVGESRRSGLDKAQII